MGSARPASLEHIHHCIFTTAFAVESIPSCLQLRSMKKGFKLVNVLRWNGRWYGNECMCSYTLFLISNATVPQTAGIALPKLSSHLKLLYVFPPWLPVSKVHIRYSKPLPQPRDFAIFFWARDLFRVLGQLFYLCQLVRTQQRRKFYYY